MIFGLISSFGQFLGELSFGTLRFTPESSAVGQAANDCWLFEGEGHVSNIKTLPDYPQFGRLTDGEAHRLDLLTSAIRELSGKLAGMQRTALAVSGEMALGSTLSAKRVRVGAVQDRKLTTPSRFADSVVSEFLFDKPAAADELDDELFETAGVVEGLVAAKMSGRLEGISPFTVRSNSTGEVNPMLYGVYS